jgi:NAD(P)H-flavin reductase
LIDSIVEKRAQFGRVHVLLGARTPDEFLYKDSFEGWRRAQIDVQTTVDRPHGSWQGHVGVVTLLLERISIDNPTNTTILTCGPEVMMRYVARTAKGRGIIDADIWVTLERNMNCAIGLCGHCQLGPAFLCKDGPVFRFDQVQPWLQIRDL